MSALIEKQLLELSPFIPPMSGLDVTVALVGGVGIRFEVLTYRLDCQNLPSCG